ncbi:MAG TPA: TldD/PmbA family protein, partial [Marmoricola sp.]|nr:TldD/PmbA family protein [Marmoricola sp.]
MTKPQELAEYALARTRASDCVAIIEETSAVNLRWANSSLTTNGSSRALQATIIAIDGPRNVSVAGPARTYAEIDRLLERAETELADAPSVEDANALVAGGTDDDWGESAAETNAQVFAGVVDALAASFNPADHLQFGFVSHDAATTYLATSAGQRRRHVQWTGHYGVTARTPDHSASSWIGGATTDFRIDFAGALQHLCERLEWSRRRISLPAGRYNTVLPPSAISDLMVDAYWAASAREALDGQSVYATPEGQIRWGEQMGRPGVHLFSDPSGGGYPSLRSNNFVVESRSSEMGSVYDNGLDLARTYWIR